MFEDELYEIECLANDDDCLDNEFETLGGVFDPATLLAA